LEQLLINYTNERLQQFFNHHMFVEEQEEYKREGIQWAFVDFGMDLVKTIELIEKKMGILSMLEEECIVPKATDDTYLEKMMNKHLGKHQSFGKPKPSKNKKAGVPDPHFEIHHYAGTVGYNVTGWLFKNKDPVNDAVIGMMASATNAVVSLVFTEKDDGTKKKGSSMMTISAAHRESLLKLMTNLHSTHPHFVRCIIPNEIKKSGHIDAPLVMHQLNCNGVLEGIRICMLGLPNKVPHADFMTRYSIVAPKIFADLAGQPQECAQKALVHAGMDEDSFRCGLTKIMFRAGMLSKLEEIRDAALSAIFIKMQCQSRRVLVHVLYQTKIAEKKALQSIQRNIKLYYNCRDWAWYQFYTMIKGEMEVLKKKKVEEERRKAMQEGFEKFQAMLAASVEARQAAEKESATKVALLSALKAEKEAMGSEAVEILAQIAEAEADIAKAEKKKADFIAKRDSDRIEMKKEIAANKKEADEKEAAARQGLEDGKKKTKHCFSVFGGTKKKALALEADVKAMKEEIKSLKLQISSDDKKGTSNYESEEESLARSRRFARIYCNEAGERQGVGFKV
jgi:myosin heavy chain 6/7